MISITPVFLSGGSGTRLWPVSRKSFPKQFSLEFNGKSLFQESILRIQHTKEISFSSPIVITNEEFRFLVLDQLKGIGLDKHSIILEPEGKNTGPAILAAAVSIIEQKNTFMLVMPCDHRINETKSFFAAIERSVSHAEQDKLITFGIKPDRPETGYGYIQVEETSGSNPVQVQRFIEKPNVIDAEKMHGSENFLWNSGIFLFKTDTILRAYKEHSPHMLSSVEKSVSKGSTDLSFFRLERSNWSDCDNISIDYAILEKAKNVWVIEMNPYWSDLGDWNSVWLEHTRDKNGVYASKNSVALDCNDVLLRSENEHTQVVGIGLSNLVVIATTDAFLVADKNKSQIVKEAVSILKEKKIKQAEIFPRDNRPWGWFESLQIEQGYQVKKIFVNSGAALSLQSHKHRSEHWIVVRGTATVTLENKKKTLIKGESIYIPLGAKHRLENHENQPLIIVEVQTGVYLGEDDIVRYDDIYSRT